MQITEMERLELGVAKLYFLHSVEWVENEMSKTWIFDLSTVAGDI